MDDTVKETCMKELGFQILDQDEKVTAVSLANTWNICLPEGIATLEAFAKKYENEELHKEYLVRGITRKNQTTVITVVPEAKIKAYEKQLDSFSKTIFSVSKKRTSYETLNFKLEPTAVLNINLNLATRPKEVHVIPEARPCMEKEKKSKNIFAVPGNSKQKAAPTTTEDVKKSPPEEKKSSAQEKTPQKAVSPDKGKGSSAVKKSAEKTIKGKPVPKIQMGKGSIASFFGQKTSPPNEKKKDKVSVKVESSKDEEVMEVEESEPETKKSKTPEKSKEANKKTTEPKKVPKTEPESPKPPPPAKSKKAEKSTEDDSSRKRNLSSDRGSESDNKKNKNKSSPEEPSSKKAKKEVKTKKVEKRSRIMAICDSDSSEDEAVSNKKPVDISDDEEEVVTKPSKKAVAEDQKKKASPNENKNPLNKKRKAQRKVTKSYEDEDGFIRTVRETEEYSCSDEDVEETPRATTTKVSPVTADTKPVVKAKPATKQGSIMSFFGKK